MIESELLSMRIYLVVKVNWKLVKRNFIIDFVLKTNHWTYRIKGLNGEKVIGCFFMKNNCCEVNENELLFRTKQACKR